MLLRLNLMFSNSELSLCIVLFFRWSSWNQGWFSFNCRCFFKIICYRWYSRNDLSKAQPTQEYCSFELALKKKSTAMLALIQLILQSTLRAKNDLALVHCVGRAKSTLLTPKSEVIRLIFLSALQKIRFFLSVHCTFIETKSKFPRYHTSPSKVNKEQVRRRRRRRKGNNTFVVLHAEI